MTGERNPILRGLWIGMTAQPSDIRWAREKMLRQSSGSTATEARELAVTESKTVSRAALAGALVPYLAAVVILIALILDESEVALGAVAALTVTAAPQIIRALRRSPPD